MTDLGTSIIGRVKKHIPNRYEPKFEDIKL